MNYNSIMSKLRKIVCENLITLRKANNLTQLDLSKKINYSDKTISRWEKGEVLPDYEALETISNVYNIDIAYFFKNHNEEEIVKKNNDRKKYQYAILALFACFIWTALTMIFVYLIYTKDIIMWPLYVLGVPLTCIIINYANKHYLKNRFVFFISYSIILWSSITYIFLQLTFFNSISSAWLFYIIGVPVQPCIILMSYIKYEK